MKPEAHKQSEQEYLEVLVHEGSDFFNEAIGEALFNDQNLKVAFYNMDNGADVYTQFCEQYFPRNLDEIHRDPKHLSSMVAEAFIGDGVYGMLLRLGTNIRREEWPHIILHELSHIFCTVHELGGRNFYQEYCEDDGGDTIRNGIINAGYAVWREFIADYIATSISLTERPLSLPAMKKEVHLLEDEVYWGNSEAKKAVSLILAYIFTNRRISQCKSFDQVRDVLSQHRIFKETAQRPFYDRLCLLVYQQLEHDPCWEISLDFIMALGRAYLSIISGMNYAL